MSIDTKNPLPSRPSLAHAIATGVDDTGNDSALEFALADDEERFLINMGNLDYGPFTMAEVVKRIEKDEVRPGHTIIDNDTGNREAVEDNELLAALVLKAAERREDNARAEVENVMVTKDKRKGTALYAFIAITVLALGGGAYGLVTKLAAGGNDDANQQLGSLEDGALEIKLTSIDVSKSSTKKRRRGRRAASASGSAWDDSNSLDMSGGGGDERLGNSQINPVIQKHGGRLGKCLRKTGSSTANIEFIIKGTGKVSQVRVNGQTGGALTTCIRGAMGRMKFPTFDGNRTKATFSMSI